MPANYNGYLADVKQMRNSGHLPCLVTLVKEVAGDTTADRATLFDKLRPFIDDLDKLRDADEGGETPNQHINVTFKDAGSGKVPWRAQLLLAWLCYSHQLQAIQLYEESGLAAKIGEQLRRFEGQPGAIAARRRGEQPAPTIAEDDGQIGPIMPVFPPSRLGGPAIDASGLPLEAPIRLPHPDGLLVACYSPDGRFIITGGAAKIDGSGVFAWNAVDITSSDRKVRIAHHNGGVAWVDVSPDGSRIAAAFENSAGVYYAAPGLMPIHLLEHKDQITTISYAPNGRMLATSSWDKTARMWNAETADCIWTFEPLLLANSFGDHIVNCVSFSPDSQSVVLACTHGVVSIWSTRTGRKMAEIPEAHETTYGATSARFSPDGRRIATTGGTDRLVRIWNADTLGLEFTLGNRPLHRDDLLSAMFSPNGDRLVTASKDKMAYIWDFKQDRIIAKLRHASCVWSAEFSPDGTRVLTACDDGNAYIWRVA